MYNCEFCNYNAANKSGLSIHNKTKKHLKNKELFEKQHIEEKKVVEEQPKLEEQKLEEQKLEEVKLQEPKLQEPKLQEPKLQEAKLQEPKLQEPKLHKKPKLDDKQIIRRQFKEIAELRQQLIDLEKETRDEIELRDDKIIKLKARIYKKKFINNEINLNDDIEIDKLTDNIINSYNTESLHKIIGDHIINIYNLKKLSSIDINTDSDEEESESESEDSESEFDEEIIINS